MSIHDHDYLDEQRRSLREARRHYAARRAAGCSQRELRYLAACGKRLALQVDRLEASLDLEALAASDDDYERRLAAPWRS